MGYGTPHRLSRVNDDLTPMKKKIEEELRQVERRADKARREQTLSLSSLQEDAQTAYGHFQQLHQKLEQTSSHHTWRLACTQDAVAQLAADAPETIERDRQATAGAIATVKERTTITQLRTQQELDKN